MVFHAAAGGFYAVYYHHHGSLAREGGGTIVSEVVGVDCLTEMGFFVFGIEIAGEGGAVVGADKLLHLAGQVVLLGQVETVGYVADDDGGTLAVIELVVRIEAAVLVLGEEEGGTDFADVVVEGSHLGQDGVAATLVDEVFADIRHLDGMLEGARGVAR